MKKRSDMKPGEMFVYRDRWMKRYHTVMVVLDTKTETDFYYGGLCCLGSFMPSELFQMVNE